MLKNFTLSNPCFSKALSVFIVFTLASVLSCGKRQPPQPPVTSVNQRGEISAVQQGDIIALTWTLPSQNASAASILNISRADVYRLTEPSDAPLALSEEEFATRSVLISTVKISEADFRRQKVTFTDRLNFAGQNARLRYAVRYVNDAGQKAAFSNILLIEPSVKVADRPTTLRAVVSEDAVELTWNAPVISIDGTKSSGIIGYNIYRSGAVESVTAQLINTQPLKGNVFRDISVAFGQDYYYFVRTLSLGVNGDLIESADSEGIKVEPRDIFPPSSPSAITIAAAPENLSIFFAANPEKDVAGYRVYRSTDSTQPISEWKLLNQELLLTNTFQDRTVISKNTYFYYLTAVDLTGNTSAASVIVTETAP